MDILFQQGRNKRGQVGFFPESYVEVGSTSAVSTPTSSYTDGPPVGSPVSVSSVGKATLGSRKYREFGLSIMLFWCGGGVRVQRKSVLKGGSECKGSQF